MFLNGTILFKSGLNGNLPNAGPRQVSIGSRRPKNGAANITNISRALNGGRFGSESLNGIIISVKAA